MAIKNILELFDGIDNIKTRMAEAIQTKLMERTNGATELAETVREKKIKPTMFWRFADPDILTIAKERGIKPELLWEIYEGRANGKVTFELFEDLQWSLDLSIDDVLGDPKISDNKTLEFWEDQRLKAPMLTAAGITHGNNEEIGQSGSIDLKLYLTLRAIEELAWNPDS